MCGLKQTTVTFQTQSTLPDLKGSAKMDTSKSRDTYNERKFKI